jgi:hypothetical protein
MFFPISEWFPAFVLTLVVEAPVAFVLLRRVEPSLARLGVLVATVNLATHLAVWFVFSQLFVVRSIAYVAVAEGWAIAAETVFYAAVIGGLGIRRAALVAVAANAASFLAGRLLGAFWPDLLA